MRNAQFQNADNPNFVTNNFNNGGYINDFNSYPQGNQNYQNQQFNYPQQQSSQLQGQNFFVPPQQYDETYMQQPYQQQQQPHQFQQPPQQQSHQFQPLQQQQQQPNQYQGSQKTFMPNFGISNEVIANTAVKYGADMMEHGTEYLQRNIDKYVPTSTLKYYFAVSNSYVAKKLMILLFPFAHRNWEPQYNPDKQPVPPRYDTNAPDLYIPMMGVLTFVLNCGLMLGINNQFSPDQLGTMASKAIGWLFFEIVVLLVTLYVVNARTSLRYMDMIAYSGYKFVGMNIILLMSLLLHTPGYNCSLLYFSIALDYFLMRTLKIQVLPHHDSSTSVSDGNKRRMYLLLVTMVMQPLVMWLLTRSVVPQDPTALFGVANTMPDVKS